MKKHLAAALLMAPLVGLAGPATADVMIAIDKSTQTMTVAVDGEALYHWRVSTGMPGRETPAGSFQPFRMEADHFSKEWDDAPMPHSIFFTKIGHAIHGSAHRLGSPVSHGCVRISEAHAATLYALVEKEGLPKTHVTITGTEPIAPEPRIARSDRFADPPRYAGSQPDREARRREEFEDDAGEPDGDAYPDGPRGTLYDETDPYVGRRHLFSADPGDQYSGSYGTYPAFPTDPYLDRDWE